MGETPPPSWHMPLKISILFFGTLPLSLLVLYGTSDIVSFNLLSGQQCCTLTMTLVGDHLEAPEAEITNCFHCLFPWTPQSP